MPRNEGVPEQGAAEAFDIELRKELEDILSESDPQHIKRFYETLTFVAGQMNADPAVFHEVVDRAYKEKDKADALGLLITGLAPVIQFIRNNPAVMEARIRELGALPPTPEMQAHMRESAMRDGREKVRLSEIMICTFEKEKGLASIHILPGSTLPLREIRKGLREGMKELAKIVKKDESIKEIEGVSWIVAEKPSLVEAAGFTLHGLVEQAGGDPNEIPEPIGRATMTRETLLERYGEKSN